MLTIEAYEETILSFLEKKGISKENIKKIDNSHILSMCFQKGRDPWKVFLSLYNEYKNQ